MSGTRLVYDIVSDSASFSVVSEAYQQEAEYLVTQSPSEKWSTDDQQTAEYLDLDLGANPDAVGAFIVLGHNFDGTETGHSLVASDTYAGLSSPSFSQTITHRTGTFVEMFTHQTYRYWRWQFTKANATDLRGAGRMILAPYYELPRGPGRGSHTWGWVDTTVTSRTRGGVLYGDTGARLRTLRLTMPAAPEAQADVLNIIAQTNGSATPFAVSVDHDNEPLDWFIYGRLSGMVGQRYAAPRAAGGHLWSLDLQVEEVK